MNRLAEAMPIYISNKSTEVSDSEATRMTAAVQEQVSSHFAPAWGIPANPVQFLSSSDSPPETGALLTIVDTPDQDGVLGWHTEGQGGVIYGYVFAKPVLDNGGDVLTGSTYTVAATLSHEVLETIADPHINLWATGRDGWVISQEVCDPVENASYDIDGVSVSDFVTPAWFDIQAPTGAKLDHLGRINSPFQIDRGGYYVHLKSGKPAQVFGDQVPDWRRKAKSHIKSRAGHLTALQTLKHIN